MQGMKGERETQLGVRSSSHGRRWEMNHRAEILGGRTQRLFRLLGLNKWELHLQLTYS